MTPTIEGRDALGTDSELIAMPISGSVTPAIPPIRLDSEDSAQPLLPE